MVENQGLNPEEILRLKQEFAKAGKPYRFVDEDEVSDEMTKKGMP